MRIPLRARHLAGLFFYGKKWKMRYSVRPAGRDEHLLVVFAQHRGKMVN